MKPHLADVRADGGREARLESNPTAVLPRRSAAFGDIVNIVVPTTGQSSASAESHLCGTAFRQAIGVEVDLLCDQIPQTILHIKAGSVRFYCVTRHMASLAGLGRVLVVKPICRQDKELALIPISVFPQIAAFCSTQTTTPTKLKACRR